MLQVLTQQAHDLLEKFIDLSRELYDNSFISLIVHCLQHLAYEVHRLELPLDAFSCYKFENVLKTLKNHVSSPKNPLSTIKKKLLYR